LLTRQATTEGQQTHFNEQLKALRKSTKASSSICVKTHAHIVSSSPLPKTPHPSPASGTNNQHTPDLD